MSKTTNYLRYRAPDGQEIVFPVAVVTGKNDGPHFVITAGIHGAEYPAIAAAIALFQELKPEDITGKITIVTISSLNAFEARSIFVNPADAKNPNRVFPGNPDGTYTEILVHHLFKDIICTADYYLDLHGGDMVEELEPFGLYHIGVSAEIDRLSRELTKHYALPHNIATTSDSSWNDSGTTYANAARRGIPAAIVEAGGAGRLDRASVEIHLRGLKNTLRHFGCLAGEAFEPRDQQFYQDFFCLYTPVKGFFYCAVELGSDLEEQQLIGTVKDYFGNHLLDITSPVAGKVLFRTTSPAMAENGLILGLGVK